MCPVTQPSRTALKNEESPMGHMMENDYRASRVCRADAMLARFRPLGQWMQDERPTPEMARLGLGLVREVMALAALTPDEERAVKSALELDDATAIVETNNDCS
jgi:hypothetical protein